MEIINNIFMWLSGFVFGWWVMGKFAKKAMQEVLMNLDLTEEQLIEALKKSNAEFMIEDEEGNDITNHVPIRIEKHGEQLYAYTVKDNTFIAQGTDADSLFTRMRERFKNVEFRVDRENGAEHIKGYI